MMKTMVVDNKRKDVSSHSLDGRVGEVFKVRIDLLHKGVRNTNAVTQVAHAKN
jgi:hypothetical protein